MYFSMSVCVSLVGGWGGSGLAGPRWDTSPSLGCGGLSLPGVALDISCISICLPLIWFSDTPTLLTGCLLGFKHSRLALQTGSSAQQVGVCQVKSWTLTE